MTTTGIFTGDFLPEDQSKAKTYECINCSMVSENNYCIDCNHCICTECLKKIKKCPIDNRIIDENTSFSFNFIGNNLLEALKVFCIYKYNGCTWMGTKKQLEEMHYHKCQFRDDKRKLVEMNMNNFNIFGNNSNVINNVEEHINNATKMILRKKTKKKTLEFDEDYEDESSYSNFSQRYLGNDEDSVVEVDSDVDFRKNKYDLDKKLITKTKEKFIDLEGDENNMIHYIDDDDNKININNNRKNDLKVIKIDGKFENEEFFNKRYKNKRLIEIQNDIKIREMIKRNEKNIDVVQIYGDENCNLSNKAKPKEFIKINDDINYIKPKKNIISLEEENEIIELGKDFEEIEDDDIQNKVFVFK